MMSVSLGGVRFIENWEGFRSTAYKDCVGVWTIGYGHVIRPDEMSTYMQAILTEKEASCLLKKDLRKFENVVDIAVKVSLSQEQYDALVSLAYNIGGSAFTGSTLVKLLNAKNYAGAANQFLRWCKGGKPLRKIEGLARRREAERRMFAEGMNWLAKFFCRNYFMKGIYPASLDENYCRLAHAD